MFFRRVIRPWLGLKMIDLNDMLAAQLKEKDAKFPDVNRGILVPMVCFFLAFSPPSYHDSECCLEVCCVINAKICIFFPVLTNLGSAC